MRKIIPTSSGHRENKMNRICAAVSSFWHVPIFKVSICHRYYPSKTSEKKQKHQKQNGWVLSVFLKALYIPFRFITEPKKMSPENKPKLVSGKESQKLK